jgi:hypothetical protein
MDNIYSIILVGISKELGSLLSIKPKWCVYRTGNQNPMLDATYAFDLRLRSNAICKIYVSGDFLKAVISFSMNDGSSFVRTYEVEINDPDMIEKMGNELMRIKNGSQLSDL